MTKNIFESIVGAVIICFVVAFVYLFFISSDDEKGLHYNIFAYFEDATGILRGSDVTIAGIKVGEVKNVEFDKKRRLARVDMSIIEEISLPEDSYLKIASNGLMSESVIKIELGLAETFVSAGGEIERTDSSNTIRSLIGGLF